LWISSVYAGYLSLEVYGFQMPPLLSGDFFASIPDQAKPNWNLRRLPAGRQESPEAGISL